jgi:hypothetical protein
MRTRQRRLTEVGVTTALAAAVCIGGIPAASAAPITHDWTGVAKCESGGDWQANTGNGYYGGLQFSLGSWQAAGGTDYAARPDLATQEQQEMTAENLLAMQGVGAWPVCGKYLTAAPASAPAPAPAPPADPSSPSADPAPADPSAPAADPSADSGGSPPPATSADPLPADTPPDPGSAAPSSDAGSSATDLPADSTGDQSPAGDSSASTSDPSSSSTSSTTPWSQYGSGGWGPAAGTAGTQPAVPAPGGTTTGTPSNGGPARTETGTSSASSAATTGGADGTDATSGTAQNRTSPAPVRASGRGAWEAAGQYNQTVAQAKTAGQAVPVAPGEAAYTQARTQPAATPASAPAAAPVVDIGSAVAAAPMSTTSSWSRNGTSPNPATRGTGNSTGNQGTGNPGPDNTGTGDPSVAGTPSPAAPADAAAGAAPPAADAPAPAAPAAAAPAAAPVHADVTNTAGPLTAKGQAMADAVAGSGCPVQSMGGTRSSAIDPAGHPSGNAVDFMVGSGNKSAGDCVANFLIAHWDELGMKYVIWQQAILQSKDGQWEPMADRGSPTANHMDHVHGEVA